jgi:HTH-type transcriptional regulator/antitoxin HigA
MEVKPIKTEHDYAKALAEIEKLFDANPETPASDRLEILITLVELMRTIIMPFLCQTRLKQSSIIWRPGG